MLASVAGEHGTSDLVVTCLEDGSVERITYAQAYSRSATMAARLINVGVTKGVRVGILAPNGPEFVVALLAVTRIGAVAVPLNSFLQPVELAWVLRDADVHTVLSVESILGKDLLDPPVGRCGRTDRAATLRCTPSASQRPPAGKNFD